MWNFISNNPRWATLINYVVGFLAGIIVYNGVKWIVKSIIRRKFHEDKSNENEDS